MGKEIAVLTTDGDIKVPDDVKEGDRVHTYEE